MTRAASLLTATAFLLSTVGCASSVRITSNRPGAKILIDGKDTGYLTPNSIRPRKIPNGAHELTVALDGYEKPEPRVIHTRLSAGLVIWSLLWPPAFLVNLFKGFSATKPEVVHFELRPMGGAQQQPSLAAAASPPPAARSSTSIERYEGERRQLTNRGLRCAAMPLRTQDIAGAMAFVADELLLAELQQSGFEAIGPDDINAMLGLEKTKDALSCDEAGCAAEIGNALGVSYLVAGNIAGIEGSVVLTLKLIDVKGTRVIARVSNVASGGDKSLPRMLGAAVGDLVAQSGL